MTPSTIISLTAHGLLLLHANPGVSLRVTIAQGLAHPVIDGAGSGIVSVQFADPATLDRCILRDVGHGWQVGYLVEPVAGAIIVPELGLTWTTSQLDFNASGKVDTYDFLTFHDLYDAGSCLCDFDADGIVRWEDAWAFDAAWQHTYPADFVPLDGYISADDYDRFIEAFVAGDPSADVNGDGWVSGEDHDLFTTSFLKGIP